MYSINLWIVIFDFVLASTYPPIAFIISRTKTTKLNVSG